jgi:CDP-2,3-bis-(O-geranylgeranyl)-sn-glycerol synthase
MIELIYFFLPVYFANMVPVFVKKINFLNFAINKKIFGKNKTYRGFFFGITTGLIVIFIQKTLFKYDFFIYISLIDYNYSNIFLVGFLLSFGALFGDLVKSFFKRKLKIKEGKSWILFDQIDAIIGSIIFIYPIVKFSLIQLIQIISISFVLIYFSVKFAYVIKLRKE